jgi:hypothetical protein
MKNSFPDVSTIASLILKEDPMDLYFPDAANTDEYEGEARRISGALEVCQTYDECLDMIWSVFKESFGVAISKSREHYAPVARAIWGARVGPGRDAEE